MADIKMKEQEYLDLVFQCKDLEELTKCIASGSHISYERHDSWEHVSVSFTPQWPESTQLLIRDNIAEQALENEELMDYMVREESHHINTQTFSIERVWKGHGNRECVDLLDNKKFYNKYHEKLAALNALEEEEEN